MSSIGDYNTIMSDHNIFNQVVYTPLSDALRLLEERRKDEDLVKKVDELLKGDIPEVFRRDQMNAVLFRQVATPNHESRYFHSLSKEFNLRPIFFQYLKDKFTSNNEFKHSLGQLRVHHDVNKNDVYPIEKHTIVDFNKYNGHHIHEVETLWGENLIKFHRDLFNHQNLDISDFDFYDASFWFKNNGEKAKVYYQNFFLLFTCHGILFENFLMDGPESGFTKDVVLPAIDYVFEKTGVRPLIVPIAPMETETDGHWISYPENIKNLILNK